MANPRFPKRDIIAQIFGVDGDTFHDEIKDEIIDSVAPDLLIKLGRVDNPDIGVDEEGFIWISKSKTGRNAERTNLTVDMFKRDVVKKIKWSRDRQKALESLDEEE